MNPQQERAFLLNACHRLLDEIARRPASLRGLYGAFHALQLQRAYKDPSYQIKKPPSMCQENFEQMLKAS